MSSIPTPTASTPLDKLELRNWEGEGKDFDKKGDDYICLVLCNHSIYIHA